MSDLLPKNSTSLERAAAQANGRISDIPVDIRDVWNPDICPEFMLPWLAWALSVDEWDPAWSEQRRRATIKSSVSVHKYKGTIAAVREALSALFADAHVQEWFNQTPSGTPYTFKVLLDIDQAGISQEMLRSIEAVIERTKNLRSHLDRIEPLIKSRASTYLAAVSSVGHEVQIDNYVRPVTVINQLAMVI